MCPTRDTGGRRVYEVLTEAGTQSVSPFHRKLDTLLDEVSHNEYFKVEFRTDSRTKVSTRVTRGGRKVWTLQPPKELVNSERADGERTLDVRR